MGFAPDWLALREPVDHASRDAGLLAQAVALAGKGAVVVDLGSGTGSTARAFDAAVCQTWHWRFVDEDAGLLAIAKDKHPASEPVVSDLKDIAGLNLADTKLVTASALLDLMPYDWVDALAARLGAASIPFYAAINYDGDMRWAPEQPQDADVTQAFNAHQRRDKGLGLALGPTSGATTAQIFERNGFEVTLGQSPWKLGPDQAALHRELLAGIGDAATQMGCAEATAWTAARQADVAQSTAHIGHADLLAVPRGLRGAGE